MQYLLYFLIVILALVLWSIINEQKQKKQLRRKLKSEWSGRPEADYTSEKLASIKAFYQAVKDDRFDIDDITWNDLDMDELFMLMNNTQCAMGEEYLYALLHKPCFSEAELKERNRLMDYFQSEEEERLQLQEKLHAIGKLKQISVYEYSNRLSEEEPGSNAPHILMALGLLASVGVIFLFPGLGAGLSLFFIVINIYSYYKYKARIENYLTVISFQLRLLKSIREILKLELTKLDKYTSLLHDDLEVFKSFQRGASILVSKNISGSILDSLVDYVRMLFHIDLMKYNSMLSFFKKNREVLNRIFTTIGFLDSMIAAASYRAGLAYYCIPKLTTGKRPGLEVRDVYHPLLNSPVPNSISEERCTLLTGSNASGKSTFLKSLAINAILAQTIDTSLSRQYRAPYFIIYSSMALKDDILSNESYFIVEIKSLKRILDHVNRDIPILCFIDEVLRGTNTLERIAASSRILVSLARQNTLCFAATHDIELTHILENHYSNYHFQERIEKGRILFDYKLYQGRAVSRNAIKLLNLLGYKQDIIQDAENAASEYMQSGEWRKI